ncbi:MAG: tetratricopeptide repeat protein [Syntrophomonadaceae bacterium]
MNKKKISIVAGLVVVLIVAFGAGLWSRGAADRAQEKLELAVKYISENDFDKAVLAYNDAIKIDPKQVKAYQGLAKVYTLQGKYDEAKVAYDKGVAAVAVTDQNTLRLGLAGMYIDKGQLPDAEKAFQTIINSEQNCLEAYWGLAMVYQKQGDNAKVEATLRQAVAKYPNDYRGYNILALFLKQNNKADDAFNNIVKSLIIEINQQEAYLVLSDMYKGRWNELSVKLSTVSNSQVSAMMEFYLYYASDDTSKAINTYKAKLSGSSVNPKACILAAIAMCKSGDRTEAETLINQVLTQNFNDWLLSDLALYYQVAGDSQKARLCAIKAIQANSTNLEAVALLQKSNTGDEKKYAAEFLFYNWKPVGIANEELQGKSLPVFGVAALASSTPKNEPAQPEAAQPNPSEPPAPFSQKDCTAGALKLDIPENEALKIIGQPTRKTGCRPGDIPTSTYYYPFGLVRMVEGGGVNCVYWICIQTPDMEGPRGSRVGDTLESVMARFPYSPGQTKNGRQEIYTTNDSRGYLQDQGNGKKELGYYTGRGGFGAYGVKYTIEDGKVTEINISEAIV